MHSDPAPVPAPALDRIRHIKARISTRTFDGAPLGGADLALLEASMARHGGAGPFGHKVRFALLRVEADAQPLRMGTYGLISGASAFLVCAVERGPGAMEDLGYAAEAVVLDATAAGLGSCWIGGLFSRGAAAEAIGARADEIVPAVVALGHAATRRSIADRIVAGAAKARSRKPGAELFVLGEGRAPTPAESGILEAVRLGPSASNKQPWRILREAGVEGAAGGADAWLLCLAEDKAYNSALGEAKMQNIDMGIAMRHFADAAAAQGLAAAWDTSPRGGSADRARELGWSPVARALPGA